MLFICNAKTIAGLRLLNTVTRRIRMQNHKCNEVENAIPIFKVSRLVRVHTDSHHNGHNKMIFAVSDV